LKSARNSFSFEQKPTADTEPPMPTLRYSSESLECELLDDYDDPRERRQKVYFMTLKGRTRVAKALEGVTGGPVDFTPTMAKEGLSRL
jgi:hypothetical protein